MTHRRIHRQIDQNRRNHGRRSNARWLLANTRELARDLAADRHQPQQRRALDPADIETLTRLRGFAPRNLDFGLD
jgi:hypothetical protein